MHFCMGYRITDTKTMVVLITFGYSGALHCFQIAKFCGEGLHLWVEKNVLFWSRRLQKLYFLRKISIPLCRWENPEIWRFWASQSFLIIKVKALLMWAEVTWHLFIVHASKSRDLERGGKKEHFCPRGLKTSEVKENIIE